jgi:hypothetical protein
MEAIPASLRDLTKMARRSVEKSCNIAIFLRLLSSQQAILPQTSIRAINRS